MKAQHHPQTGEELIRLVLAAGAEGRKLELRGGGTKAGFGSSREAEAVDLRAFSGVLNYDPAELVLVVRAGTPLAEVQALVSERGQMLAFDPWEAGPLFGGAPEGATIGGTVAAGVAGPLRISGGGARDHLLGFTAVSGRGELFKAGGKVVKNVTGFDLSKLMTASWGQLAAMTELTLKVMPRPVMEITLALIGLCDRDAIAAMSAALGSAVDVAAVAHVPREAKSLTLFQLRGFERSIVARRGDLEGVLACWGRLELQDDAESLWSAVRRVGALELSAALWRVVIPPSRAAEVAATLGNPPRLYDLGGNVLWIGGDVEPRALRAAAAGAGGHATLVRAPPAMRAVVPAFHPVSMPAAMLEERVRRAFDPCGVFESARFQGGTDAD